MKIAYITAGAAGMYCGTCLHDNTLATALMQRGHEVSLLPTYTPSRTDEENVSVDRVFFGAINVYLQQKLALFRHTPKLFDRLLDNQRLLGWVSRFSGSTDAADLGALTLSMIEGESGHQAKELDKLVSWLDEMIHPDIVHLSHTLFIGFAHRLREELKVPVVCSLQGEDLFFDDLQEPYFSRVLEALAERTGEVDAYTSPCHYYSELMAERFSVPRDRIHLVRLGVNPASFDLRPLEDPLPAKDAPVTIGYLARFCPEKGVHLLLDAFHLLVQGGDQTSKLRIAGYLGEKDRAFYEEQRQKVERWGLEDRIDFVGEVDLEGKREFLKSLDLFSMPTVYREPKGLPVLEALMTGVPVVQPAHGAFPEWVEETGGGILVEPESAAALARGLASLTAEPAERLRLARAGARAARERFHEGTMAEETLALYRRVLGA